MRLSHDCEFIYCRFGSSIHELIDSDYYLNLPSPELHPFAIKCKKMVDAGISRLAVDFHDPTKPLHQRITTRLQQHREPLLEMRFAFRMIESLHLDFELESSSLNMHGPDDLYKNWTYAMKTVVATVWLDWAVEARPSHCFD